MGITSLQKKPVRASMFAMNFLHLWKMQKNAMKHYFERNFRNYRGDYERNLMRFHKRNLKLGAVIGTILGLLHYFGLL